jgi:hypothetical protein
VRPAVLARARQARQLDHQRPRGPGGELVEEALYRGNVGEAVQPVAVDAQLAGGLRPAQH